METFDRNDLRKIAAKKSKVSIPEVTRGHGMYFNIIFSELLGYVDTYESEDCEKFLERFEFSNRYKVSICKFIWQVGNFQP